MVAPKAPGHRVREVYEEGGGTPVLIAVHQDASGKAFSLRFPMPKAWAEPGRRTDDDLYGRNRDRLVRRTDRALRRHFSPGASRFLNPGRSRVPARIGLFRVHARAEADRGFDVSRGLNFMRFSVSDTAEYGDYVAGKRIITPETKKEMKKILAEIQNGSFANNGSTRTRTADPGSPRARTSAHSPGGNRGREAAREDGFLEEWNQRHRIPRRLPPRSRRLRRVSASRATAERGTKSWLHASS